MSENVVLGCSEPSVAIRVTVDVVTGVVVKLAPQPVHTLIPIPAAAASARMRAPRRRFHPRQHSAIAIAEPGIELLSGAVLPVEAATVSVVVATSPAGVTELGENWQDAPEGNPEQLNETAAEYPFTGVTTTAAVLLCPCVTMNDVGKRLTRKVGRLDEATA
jgi:hypothetical protein